MSSETKKQDEKKQDEKSAAAAPPKETGGASASSSLTARAADDATAPKDRERGGDPRRFALQNDDDAAQGAELFRIAKERESLDREREAIARERAQLQKERELLNLGPSLTGTERPGGAYRGPFRVLSGFRYTDPETGEPRRYRPKSDGRSSGYILRRGDVPDDVAQDMWRRGALEPIAEPKQLVPAPPPGV